MTVFVKSFGDWFTCRTPWKFAGDNLIMSSTKTSTQFPEPVEAVQVIDFGFEEAYVLSRSNGRPETVYFEGMSSDTELLFSRFDNTEKVSITTNLKGVGQGFCIVPERRALCKGDKLVYAGQQAEVVETDDDLTVLLVAEHYRVFSTAYLIGVI